MLRIKWHWLKVLLGCLVLNLSLWFGVEGLLRTTSIGYHFTQPSFTPANVDFNHKYQALAQYVDAHGPIDCIFLGSSLVINGINPTQVGRAYEEKTAQPLHCYNFGLAFLTPSSALAITPLLIQNFHPKLVIVGFTARDLHQYTAVGGESYQLQEGLALADWVRYYRGEWTLQGWLTEVSYVYRYRNVVNQEWLLTGQQPRLYRKGLDDPTGYWSVDYYRLISPRYTADSQVMPAAFNPDPQDIASLQQLDQLPTGSTNLLWLEMPVSSVYKISVMGSVEAYNRYMQELRATLSNPYWRVDDYITLNKDDWHDDLHLFITGSFKLSDWLGKQLGLTYPTKMDSRLPSALPDPTVIAAEIPISRATYGLNMAAYVNYQQSVFDEQLPSNAILFSPVNSNASPSIASQMVNVGLAWEWSDQTDLAFRQGTFQLLHLLEQVRDESQLQLTEAQQQALAAWRNTKSASALQQAGLEYLWVTNTWLDFLSDAERAQLDQHYHLLGRWGNPLEPINYYLYAIAEG